MELLIVIALIAILSVAVLATINPIEQSNKARDARVQNDAAEIMNAAERYYASVSKYPWESFADDLTSADAVVLSSIKMGFGICNGTGNPATDSNSDLDATSCSATDENPNLLISTSELKSSFAGKDEFQPVLDGKLDQGLWLAKQANENAFYVCYIPKANANRVVDDKMRCIFASGEVAKIGGDCIKATGDDWSTTANDGPEAIMATAAVLRCVPE